MMPVDIVIKYLYIKTITCNNITIEKNALYQVSAHFPET